MLSYLKIPNLRDMAPRREDISDSSSRIARNTVMLYFRMLLMLFVGLYTSRVILRSLGVDDYGIYNAVGGLVTVFTFITGAISTATQRFLTYEMGRGDGDRLRRVFGASVFIQILISLVLVLLVETAGAWFLHHRMDIPAGRMDAASFVLHTSVAVLVLNLLSVPYNAVILAHEKMGAYALISLMEAFFKLAVALLLAWSPFDKLRSYALLMLAVAFLTRLVYGIYCRRHFTESRGLPSWDPPLFSEMLSFALWSFFGSGSYILNTQGVNVVSNLFFGVAVNAARGVATQVEGMVKLFISNMLTAFNPQITKSWASGDRDYCFLLARKASKYAYLIILTLMLPLCLESHKLLELWLVDVPEYADLFVSLGFCTLLEMVVNPLHTIQLATGKVRRYFLLTGGVSYLLLPMVWLAFRLGAPAWSAYPLFFLVYLLTGGLRLALVHRDTGFPVGIYLKLLLRLAAVTLCAVPLPLALRLGMPEGLPRLALVLLTSVSAVLPASWLLALTPGEKAVVRSRLGRLRKTD